MAYSDEHENVICEGYLYKTKPIDRLKLLTTWKHKYFLLSKTDKATKFELAYYTDDSKKGKCRYVELDQFVAIKTSVSAGRREHCFAIELRKRTYVLQAGDFQVKNLWVAKLCEVLRQDVYHVAIPHQAQLSPGHGLLKILKVEAVVTCPSTSRQLASFRFRSLKRFGSCNDILWFEVCPCTNDNTGLYFFSVGSGLEACSYITSTIKNLLQNLTKQHMVFSNSGSEGSNYSAPQHYSCPGAAPLSQVSFIANMRKPSITGISSVPKLRKLSAHSAIEIEGCVLPQRSTTFSMPPPSRNVGQLVKQTSVSSFDGTTRTTLGNFRQTSIVSLEGSTPLSKFRQGSMDNATILESPSRQRSSTTAAERKDSGVFDEDGLAHAVSKVSVSPQNSDSSNDQATAMDSPRVMSGQYINYLTSSQTSSATDSPPISPHTNSLSPVIEQPTPATSQTPPVAPPRSLISLMARTTSNSSC